MRRSRFAPAPAVPTTPQPVWEAAPVAPVASLRGAPAAEQGVGAGVLFRENLAAAGVPSGEQRARRWAGARTRAFRIGGELATAAVSIGLLAFVVWPDPTRQILIELSRGAMTLALPSAIGLGVWAGLAWALGLPLRGLEWVQGARFVGGIVFAAGLLGWGVEAWWGTPVSGEWMQRGLVRAGQTLAGLTLAWVAFHAAMGSLQPRANS